MRLFSCVYRSFCFSLTMLTVVTLSVLGTGCWFPCFPCKKNFTHLLEERTRRKEVRRRTRVLAAPLPRARLWGRCQAGGWGGLLRHWVAPSCWDLLGPGKSAPPRAPNPPCQAQRSYLWLLCSISSVHVPGARTQRLKTKTGTVTREQAFPPGVPALLPSGSSASSGRARDPESGPGQAAREKGAGQARACGMEAPSPQGRSPLAGPQIC